MNHWTYVAMAYGVAFLTIGGVAARIVMDYRALRGELARFGPKGQRDDGDAA